MLNKKLVSSGLEFLLAVGPRGDLPPVGGTARGKHMLDDVQLSRLRCDILDILGTTVDPARQKLVCLFVCLPVRRVQGVVSP